MWGRRLALGVVIWVVSALCAAASPATFGEAWRWTRFTRASGLPSDFTCALADIPGSGLWAVTRGGLARYDGYRWLAVPLPEDISIKHDGGLASDGRGGVVALSREGRLLAGTAGGLRLVNTRVEGRELRFQTASRAAAGPVLLAGWDQRMYEWRGGALVPHAPSAALGPIVHAVQAGPRAVWVVSPDRISSWDGARYRPRMVLASRGEGRPAHLVCAAEQADGSAIAYLGDGGPRSGAWEWSATSPTPTRFAHPAPLDSVAIGPGGLVVAVPWTGALVARDGHVFAPVTTGTVPVFDVRSAGFLANGDLWVATDHGLFLHRSSSDRWRVVTEVPTGHGMTVNDLASTPDGQILLATDHGLERLAADRRSLAVPRSGTDDIGLVTGLAVDGRGRVWASSGSGFRGVRWRGADGWHALTGDARLEMSYVHKIAVDRHGNPWFLSLSSEFGSPMTPPIDEPGAFHLSADGTITRWSRLEGLPSGRVYAFDEGPDGSLWFGTAAGLSRWHNGTWRHWDAKRKLQHTRVFTLDADRHGVVWFSHQAGGVGRLEDDTVTYYTVEDGLATDSVWTVRVDERDRVWAAGEGGVSMLEHGVWTAFDTSNGLTNTRIWPVLPAEGRVFLGTRGGGLAILNLSERQQPPPLVVAAPPVFVNSDVLLRWRTHAWWGEVPSETIPTRWRLDEGPWTSWSSEREWRFADLRPGRHVVTLQAKAPFGGASGNLVPIAFEVPPPLLLDPAFYVPVTGLSLVAACLVGLIAVRQRRHHRELHDRERQFRRVFLAGPLPAVMVTLDGAKVVEVNAAFERLVGWRRGELQGRQLDELGLVDGDLELGAEGAGPDTGAAAHGRTVRLRARNGDLLDIVSYLETIELGGRRAVLGQLLDVTEQRRLEHQLRQAQKMESVGRLAGGVAHDFNNLLTVIIGNVSLMEAELPDGDPHRGGLEQVRLAAERAERLTRQLLVFARRQVVEPRIVNVNDVVLRIDRMLRRLIGEDVELVTLMDPDIDPVRIDPSQLEQVLLNMAVNSRDAMPAGGTLTIQTHNAVIGDREARAHPDARPGRFVRLSVTDTGVGMDEATLGRIFEPFFTTKEPGKGTGLGLATCYGVAKQNGGHILVESRQGRGTTFHVDLPRSEEPHQASEPQADAGESSRGMETILLVEDEVQVRRLAAAVLRRHGYLVLEAGTGPEALQVADQYRGTIHALVTDIVMPLMRGTEVARRLRERRPAIGVLFVSGYTDDERFRQEAGEERVAFLAKPFTPAGLAGRVRELLDERDG